MRLIVGMLTSTPDRTKFLLGFHRHACRSPQAEPLLLETAPRGA
jgi:hypothetical protein